MTSVIFMKYFSSLFLRKTISVQQLKKQEKLKDLHVEEVSL